MAVGCGPSITVDEDDAGDSDSDDDDDDGDGNHDDHGGEPEYETGADGDDGDHGDDGDVESPDGVFINCGDLPPDGPLVGGGPPNAFGYPTYACNPTEDHGDGPYVCCSNDAAAELGELPQYVGFDVPGGSQPYFADITNDLSRFGVCVRTDQIPAGNGLTSSGVERCPLPCNPTWNDEQIAVVCGPTWSCCQTHELRPEDCILDESTGLWRAVTGHDIGTGTDWNPEAHVTHQDPAGIMCLSYVEGDPDSPVFVDCIRQLTVADQRGFCMALSAGESCPVDPGYVDPCAALND